MISIFENHCGIYIGIAVSRLRALLWRMRGATLGKKTHIGRNCILHRPWCMHAGERTQFEHNVFIKITTNEAKVYLGNDVFVGYGAEFDITEKLWVGNNTLIAPGCFITDHNHRHSSNEIIAAQGCECRPVRIGNDVWLGARSVILPGVTIGDGAIVGSNAVVTKDVDPMTIVAGVPARMIGRRTQE